MNQKLAIFYTLCGSYNEAKALSEQILSNNMATCINLIKDIESFYKENNKIYQINEVGLIIKTLKSKEKFIAFLKSKHKYKIPFFAELKIEDINEDYVNWAIKN